MTNDFMKWVTLLLLIMKQNIVRYIIVHEHPVVLMCNVNRPLSIANYLVSLMIYVDQKLIFD